MALLYRLPNLVPASPVNTNVALPNLTSVEHNSWHCTELKTGTPKMKIMVRKKSLQLNDHRLISEREQLKSCTPIRKRVLNIQMLRTLKMEPMHSSEILVITRLQGVTNQNTTADVRASNLTH
jgi:hypothetical protein